MAWTLASLQMANRQVCRCGGYAFPHRRSGGACDHSPLRDYYLAVRQGVPKPEAETLLWADKLEKLK